MDCDLLLLRGRKLLRRPLPLPESHICILNQKLIKPNEILHVKSLFTKIFLPALCKSNREHSIQYWKYFHNIFRENVAHNFSVNWQELCLKLNCLTHLYCPWTATSFYFAVANYSVVHFRFRCCFRHYFRRYFRNLWFPRIRCQL